MELYEEQTIKNVENIESLEKMLEAEDISDGTSLVTWFDLSLANQGSVFKQEITINTQYLL